MYEAAFGLKPKGCFLLYILLTMLGSFGIYILLTMLGSFGIIKEKRRI